MLPAPSLSRADSYDVLANLRLVDSAVVVPLLTDTLERSALPGARL